MFGEQIGVRKSNEGHFSEKERRITGKNLELAANLQADSILKNMMLDQI